MEYMEEGSLADTLKDRRLSEKAGPRPKALFIRKGFQIFYFDLDFFEQQNSKVLYAQIYLITSSLGGRQVLLLPKL
jgi:hypothetical protein